MMVIGLSKAINKPASMFIFLLVAITTAFAVEAKEFTVEETLKGMKPASFGCELSPDGSSEIAYKKRMIQPDTSCAISATKLDSMRQGGKNITLVDTRQAQHFSDYHISDALNLTASAIRRKPFFKKRTVVLIGNGKAEKAQYISCAQLKEGGFVDVKVLKGGMPSWVAHQLPINGKVNANGVYGLSPLEFWAESKFAENLVVIDAKKNRFIKDMNNALVIDSTNPESFKKRVKQWQKKHKQSYNTQT